MAYLSVKSWRALTTTKSSWPCLPSRRCGCLDEEGAVRSNAPESWSLKGLRQQTPQAVVAFKGDQADDPIIRAACEEAPQARATGKVRPSYAERWKVEWTFAW